MEKPPTGFEQNMMEKYKSFIVAGIITAAFAIWLYEYHFSITGDGLVGAISSGALFIGTILLGLGIRGLRDGDDYRNRFIDMKSRGGADVRIKKRKKKWFR